MRDLQSSQEHTFEPSQWVRQKYTVIEEKLTLGFVTMWLRSYLGKTHAQKVWRSMLGNSGRHSVVIIGLPDSRTCLLNSYAV